MRPNRPGRPCGNAKFGLDPGLAPGFRRPSRRRSGADATKRLPEPSPGRAGTRSKKEPMQCFGVDLYKDETRGGTYSIADQVARFSRLSDGTSVLGRGVCL